MRWVTVWKTNPRSRTWIHASALSTLNSSERKTRSRAIICDCQLFRTDLAQLRFPCCTERFTFQTVTYLHMAPLSYLPGCRSSSTKASFRPLTIHKCSHSCGPIACSVILYFTLAAFALAFLISGGIFLLGETFRTSHVNSFPDTMHQINMFLVGQLEGKPTGNFLMSKAPFEGTRTRV